MPAVGGPGSPVRVDEPAITDEAEQASAAGRLALDRAR
jgi:hypothetical protein